MKGYPNHLIIRQKIDTVFWLPISKNKEMLVTDASIMGIGASLIQKYFLRRKLIQHAIQWAMNHPF